MVTKVNALASTLVATTCVVNTHGALAGLEEIVVGDRKDIAVCHVVDVVSGMCREWKVGVWECVGRMVEILRGHRQLLFLVLTRLVKTKEESEWQTS